MYMLKGSRCLWLAFCVATAGLPVARAAKVVDTAPPPGEQALLPPVWHTDLDSALALAGAEYRPVLVLFTSPNCSYCTKLKYGPLRNPDVVKLLRSFTLAEIDVSTSRDDALRYQVRGTPTLMVLSSDGRPQSGANGYLATPQLLAMLKRAINPDYLRRQDSSYLDLVRCFDEGELPADKWPSVMRFLGEKDKRKDLHDRILALTPFPRTNIVELLTSPRIAVRLGALEILEELAGDTYGYDPWLDVSDPDANSAALARWKAWSVKATNEVTSAYSALTEEQLTSYIQDLVSDDRDRSLRAMRMLEQGDPNTSTALANFLEENPELPRGARRRIKEIQYALHLPVVAGIKPSDLAHRLVFGTLDVRLKAITSLQAGGRRALPVLAEFLKNNDPIIRETAVDALVGAGGRRAVPILKEHLKEERDTEVIFTILRGLGAIKSNRGLGILTDYLTNPNEDLVIAALNSIAKLRSKSAGSKVAACLQDPRWRVRVAALDTVAKLSLTRCADDVEELLDDKDNFVRYSAIKTLTRLSARKATDRLEEVFLKDDDLKAPVVTAFGTMDIALPESFEEALHDKPPELLLAVVQAMEDCTVTDLPLAATFIDHPDLDVACAAVRLIARKGMAIPAHQADILKALRSGKRELVLAALESIKLDKSQVPIDSILLGDPLTAPASGSGAPGAVMDILNAFEDAPAVPAPPASNSAAGTNLSPVADILAAFSDKPGDGGKDAGTLHGGIPEIVKAVEACLSADRDDDIRFAAALLLARLGKPAVIDYFREGLENRTSAERQSVARSLAKLQHESALPVLKAMLNDPSETVRTAAAKSCFAHSSSPTFIDAVFAALLKKDSRLKPYEAQSYQLAAVTETSIGRRTMHKWLRRILADSTDLALQNFAIIMLQKCWISDNREAIMKFLASEDPYQRRAAFHTLGKCELETFAKKIPALLKDPSEYVRVVLPNVYTPASTRWIHYLDETHFDEDHYYWSSYGSPPMLPADVKKALQQLTRDPSPRVRIEAYFALLANYQSFDLLAFVDTINSFPDRNAISTRIAGYLVSNYERLGKGFSILMPYLEGSRYDDSSLKRVRDHFDVKDDTVLDDITFAARTAGGDLQATFVEPPDRAGTNTPPDRLLMVYFTSPGCEDCARAEEVFKHIREYLPELEIETHNMNKLAAKQLNEALSDRFNVPDKVRLVSPAVFSAAGYLIKSDISFAALGDLLARSAAMPDSDWHAVPEEEIERAADSLSEKGAAMDIGVVAGAGLLDGVNPCAFATIIFLLSYLQVTRRRPREIARVGIAFIVGVFLAYFALGLGLFQVVSELDLLHRGGRMLDWAIAAVALVLMVLNARDGVLCLQGRMEDMALQLPGFLKSGIHGVIRRGARHTHFVVAAFVVGAIVSFLELACTGQVYLPLIHYMLSTGKHTARAVFYLLIYNLAFIAPLIVVFVLACFGLTNERLTRFMRKHAAAVKFSTAGLFLLLFVILVFGNTIRELWAG